MNKNLNYILKPTVEDLQLLFGEVSLGLELIKALGPVTHRGHLQLIVCFICRREDDGGHSSHIFQPHSKANIQHPAAAVSPEQQPGVTLTTRGKQKVLLQCLCVYRTACSGFILHPTPQRY